LIGNNFEAIIGGAALAGFLISRQVLMPMANTATDNQQQSKFDVLHKATVLINTLQLIAFFIAFIA
jgi:hypothetical protein